MKMERENAKSYVTSSLENYNLQHYNLCIKTVPLYTTLLIISFNYDRKKRNDIIGCIIDLNPTLKKLSKRKSL